MKQVTYTIKVPVVTTWATGAPRGTGTRTFHIKEDATILGGARAIDQAVKQCNWYEDKSPDIEPNPAEEGWPIGTPNPLQTAGGGGLAATKARMKSRPR